MNEAHTLASSSDLSARADAKLERLLTRHPSPEVHGHFGPAVASGSVMISYASVPNVAAAIVAIPNPRVATIASTRRPLAPVLLVDAAEFVLGSRPDDWWTLVLYHESVHERQFAEGRIDARTFEIRHEALHGQDARRMAEQKWYAEREAYQKECGFAEEQGLARLLGPIAAAYRTSQFDVVLLANLVRVERDTEVREHLRKRLRRAIRATSG